MNKKELKTIAKKIAKQEYIIQTHEEGSDEAIAAQNEIMRLTSSLRHIEDIIAVEELISDYLAEMS